jgi:hypothetical protein
MALDALKQLATGTIDLNDPGNITAICIISIAFSDE